MKKVRNVLLAMMILSGSAFVVSACNNGGGEPTHTCGNYADSNCDGVCDNCKEPKEETMRSIPCAGANNNTSKPALAIASASAGEKR